MSQRSLLSYSAKQTYVYCLLQPDRALGDVRFGGKLTCSSGPNYTDLEVSVELEGLRLTPRSRRRALNPLLQFAITGPITFLGLVHRISGFQEFLGFQGFEAGFQGF